MDKILIRPGEQLVVLTGAGISAESGLSTFRDSGGLWEQHRVEDVASPEGFDRMPRVVWKFYSDRRVQALSCSPNPAHLALAELEKKLGDRFLLVTQNVDGLHLRAGSRAVIEMHGNLFTTVCTRCESAFRDESTYYDEPPLHQGCGGRWRPRIVWFGEPLYPGDMESIGSAIRRCHWFVAIGTSGNVYPAAGLAAMARDYGATTVLVNRDPPANLAMFDRFIPGKAGEILPGLFEFEVMST